MARWLRWAAALPVALICATLSSFPLHWVLYQTLTASGFIEPYPRMPERLLFPFAASLAFVWSGASVAPSHSVAAAIVLACILLVAAVATAVLVAVGANVAGQQLALQGGGVGPVLAVAGAFAGVYIVKARKADSAAAV